MRTWEVQIFDNHTKQTIRTLAYATTYTEAQRVARMQFPNGRVVSCIEKPS